MENKKAISFPDLGKFKRKGPSYGVWYGFITPYGSQPNRPIYGVRIKHMASTCPSRLDDGSGKNEGQRSRKRHYVPKDNAHAAPRRQPLSGLPLKHRTWRRPPDAGACLSAPLVKPQSCRRPPDAAVYHAGHLPTTLSKPQGRCRQSLPKLPTRAPAEHYK